MIETASIFQHASLQGRPSGPPWLPSLKCRASPCRIRYREHKQGQDRRR